MMYYRSTRNAELRLKSAEVIKKGLSEDGGLFVPCEIPALSPRDMERLVDMSNIASAKLELRKYLTDFTASQLSYCTEGAYGDGKFSSEAVAPLVKLGDNRYLLEQWHGPTCA